MEPVSALAQYVEDNRRREARALTVFVSVMCSALVALVIVLPSLAVRERAAVVVAELPAASAGNETYAAVSITNAATTELVCSSTQVDRGSIECTNNSAVDVYLVASGAANTTDGMGPYASDSSIGQMFRRPVRHLYARASEAGTATLRCSCLDGAAQHAASGGSPFTGGNVANQIFANGGLQARTAAAAPFSTGTVGNEYFGVTVGRAIQTAWSVGDFGNPGTLDGKFIIVPRAATIANPTDTTTAPAHAYINMSAGGAAAWTPSETGAESGSYFRATNSGANVITMTNSAGVYEKGPCAVGQYGSVDFMYFVDRFVQVACNP